MAFLFTKVIYSTDASDLSNIQEKAKQNPFCLVVSAVGGTFEFAFYDPINDAYFNTGNIND